MPFATAYTWNQTGTASWTDPTNWTPNRNSLASDDILVFNNGATTTVTNVPLTQTIGQISVGGGTKVTLQALSTSSTLTISGGLGSLAVALGSQLNLGGDIPLTISVLAGSTGSISGSMTFSGSTMNTGHQLLAGSPSGITFNNGSSFTQGTFNVGSVFGTTGTANTIVFASGSTFIQKAGADPFGLGQPSSKVNFQTGSLFSFQQTTAPSFSGRTYANLEINAAAFNQTNAIGASALAIDTLTVTAGTLGLNLTGGITIKGNISVASGASLSFSPASSNTLTFGGSSAQTISGAGTLTFGANTNFTVNNSNGVSLSRAITIPGTLTLTVGTLDNSTNNVTLGNGATITRQSGSALSATPTFGTSVNVTYTGSSSISTGPELPTSTSALNNLTANMSIPGSVTLGSAITVNGTFSMICNTQNGCGFNANAAVVFKGDYSNTNFNYVGGTTTFGGTTNLTASFGNTNNRFGSVTIGSGASVTNSAYIRVSGDWADNATTGGASGFSGGLVEFNGSGGTQSVGGSVTTPNFLGFTVAATSGGIVHAAKGLSIQEVRLSSGTFNDGGFNHSVSGITWAQTSGTMTATGTIIFNGNGNNQIISGTNAFNNLTINHTGGGGVGAQGSTLSVTGLLDAVSGTFTSATAYNNVQIDAAGELALSGPITVSGNWTNNGTFTPNGFTVTFNGSGAQTITTGGATAGKTFAGLTVSNSSGAVTVVGNLGMGGTNALGLSYASGTPTVSMTGGAFALAAGNPVTVTTTSALGAGDYVLVSAGSGGSVTGTAPTNLIMAGSGLASGMAGSLRITGSQLVLHVASAIGDVAVDVSNTTIKKLNAADGTVTWSATVANDGALAVDQLDYGVYTGKGSASYGSAGTIYKYNAIGGLVWSNSVSVSGFCNFYYVSGAAVDTTSGTPGVVWSQTSCFGGLAKSDRSTGAQQWSAFTNDIGRPSIDPANGQIYAITTVTYNTIYSATATGTVTSASSCNGLSDLNPADGMLYRGGGGCVLNLYQLNKSNLATPNWTKSLSGTITSFDALAVQPWSGGYIYVGSVNDSKIVVVNPADHSVVTSFSTAVPAGILAVNPNGGTVYVANGTSNFVYAYSPSGALVWTSPDLGGPVYNLAAPRDIVGTAPAVTPTITVVGGPLTFADTQVGATSAEQMFTVAGSNLTADITVTAPSTDFEVSKTTSTGFGPSVTFTQSGGSMATSTVFVHFKPRSFGLKSGNITNASTGATTQNVAVSGTGTLPGSLQFSAANYNDSETNADHTATITVTRTGGTGGAVAVHWSTSAGTATAGTDYTEASGDLNWADGDAADKTFTVTVKGDTTYEANETVNLTLSAPTNGATLGAPNPSTLTIVNDDALPATLVVNTTADHDDGFCTPLGSGDCTLREAINAANSNADVSTINFNIPGTDTGCNGTTHICKLAPTTQLPTITQPVIIDGYSQPGASANTLSSGDDAVILIEISGASEPAGSTGLTISAGSSTVQGLAINGFISAGGFPFNGRAIVLQTQGGNTIQGNFIGTDAAGNALSGSSNFIGVHIDNVPNNVVGGTTPAARNLISGNYDVDPPHSIFGGYGILLFNSGATGNQIQGNYIGTNPAGTGAVLNSQGVLVFASSNTIGGTAAGAGNLISGNGAGINISGGDGNAIQGNFIGTNSTGTAAVANVTGVYVSSATNNTIGGTTTAARNLISGNTDKGIVIQSVGTNNNLVQGNFIGVNAAGTAALGNGGDAVTVYGGARDNTVGGTTAAARNIISGNAGNGVFIGYYSRNNVQGNYIGTDVTGTIDLGNGGNGIFLQTDHADDLVGGTVAGAGNLISGNAGNGVYIRGILSPGPQVQNITVQGNLIGTQADGLSALGNDQYGIRLDGAAYVNTIGGTALGAGNTIAFNGSGGIYVESGFNNAFRGNSIFSNTGLGIDLLSSPGPGTVTLNDNKDLDDGANHLQNFPIITQAEVTGGSQTISGTLNSAPNQTFAVDLFASASCDGSGNGEGQIYLGSPSVTTNANGDGSFTFHPATLSVGQFVTATATDADGNTSEFSQCFTVVAGTPSVRFAVASISNLETNSGTHPVTFTVQRNGTVGAASVHYASSNGTATAGSDYDETHGDFNWSDGDSSDRTITITIHGDTDYEANETVFITLSGASGTSITGTNPATLTITNDDAPPPNATFVVNTTDDLDFGACVTAHCSLREAMNAANFANDTNIINFNIPNSFISGNVFIIQPTSALPTVRSNVIIDGTSQTAFVAGGGDTNPNGPEVVVNGASAGTVGGFFINGDNCTIKGLVVNGFAGGGISIGYGAYDLNPSSNQILNNYIGTDPSGTVAVPNGGAGVGVGGFGTGLTADSNTVSGNLISGNTGLGISTCDVTNATISGNKIGTKVDGTSALGNSSHGIHEQCTNAVNNTISGNTIAFNGGDGIFDQPDSRFGDQHHFNKFTQNSIYSNGGLGINLIGLTYPATDGVTPNDDKDPDNGANSLQNFPVITSAKVTGTLYKVIGTLNTTPNTSGYVIEFFKNSACDGSGNGEGQTYLGNLTTGMTDANGNVSFTFISPTPFAASDVITTTATDASGNTSEFSACNTAVAGAPGTLQFSSATYSVAENVAGGLAHIIVTRTGGSDGDVSARFDTSNGTATAGTDYTAVTNYTVTFLEGDTSPKTVDIPITNDSDFEGDETVNLALSNPSVASLGAPASAILTITSAHTCPTLFTVNSSLDTADATPGDGLCDDGAGHCTLRAAIMEANALTDCGTINIDFSVSGPITLTNGELLVDHNVNIDGPGADLLGVDGGNTTRVFEIAIGRTVSISGLAISHGVPSFVGGGGIFNGSGSVLTLSNCAVTDSTIPSPITRGGGIFNDGGTLTLTNSTISGNAVTAAGGGIYNNGGLVTLTNSTISGNSATQGGGGGIFNSNSGTLTLTNDTFSSNAAKGGGGIFNDGGSTANVRNTIVAGNSAFSTPDPDASGAFNSLGHNLIGDATGSTGFTGTGDQVGTSLSPIDPNLGLLQNNGGPTFTHALLLGSPALDAGDDCVLTVCAPPLAAPLTTDQRGAGFPRFQGNHVDIGAFELQAYVVTKTADTNGTCLPGNCSLREAINAANDAGPDPRMIVFNIPTGGSDPGCVSGVCTIMPTTNLPALTNSIFIDGYSQIGATPNTLHLDQGDNAVLKIVLDGKNDVDISGNLRGLDLETGADGSAISGLVISHFAQAGIYIQGSGGNTISGNFIGTDVTGTIADGTGGNCISINDGLSDLIGGETPAARNLISGHTSGNGIAIFGSFVTVEGNYIGTDRSGAAALGNFVGISIQVGGGNAIGCEVLDGDNVISGNTNNGIGIDNSSGNFIQGNFIGTDRTGALAVPNGKGIVLLDSSSNTIGVINGFGNFGNVISGNTGDGIRIDIGSGSSTSNFVQGNFIGTNSAGTAAVPNSGDGVSIHGSSSNTIGGSNPGEGNVISGNGGEGVAILAGSLNTLQGNFIGVNANGVISAGMGNGGHGIEVYLSASNNVIGVPSGKAIGVNRNRFAGRAQNAVASPQQPARAAKRTAVNHATNRANQAPLAPSVQNTSAANIIAGNTGDGVRVSSPNDTGNLITQNSIFSNGKLGINLVGGIEDVNGVTANDPGDGDPGPNNLQNFPVITAATIGTMHVTGTLDSTPNGTFTIEVFVNSACDSSGYGEGKTYLATASATETSPGSGQYTWDATVPTIQSGQVFTATATDVTLFDNDIPHNDTSEFSQCKNATSANTNPTITAAAPLSRQQGTAAINGQIATVSDADQPANTLTVTATPLTGSGVTISNISIDVSGKVTADVAASCTATNSTFTLTVTDNASATADTLTVNVTANTAPTLTYATPPSVTEGNSLTIAPATGPSDNGSVTSIVVQSQGTYTGGISVNNSTGVVSISNAAPVGGHTITIRATDNCGMFTDATFTLNVNAAACTPPPSGMVAWYPGDGNADDIAGGHNGTLQNGATFAPGKVDQAFSLNGTNQYVDIASAATLPATFTIDAWVNPSSITSGPLIFAKDDGVGAGHYFQIESNGKLVGSVRSSNYFTQYRTNSAAVVAGRWQHIAMTYDGNAGDDLKMTFYVDGVNYPALHIASYDGGGTPFTGSGDAKIGILADGVTGPFAGLIDEFEVFNRVLSGTEIANIYSASFAGKCRTCTTPPGGMISWWDGSGIAPTANDIYGTNNGTLQGSATFAPGKVGQGFSFDGSGFVTVPDSPSLQLPDAPFSIDLWFKTNTTATSQMILSKGVSDANEEYSINLLANGGIYWDYGGTQGDVVSDVGAVQAGQWYHLAVLYDPGLGFPRGKIYLNGVEQTITSFGFGSHIANSGGNLYIGSQNAGSPYYAGRVSFNGLIDEVEIFNRALSPTEIAAIADAGDAGKCHTSTIQFSSATYQVTEGSASQATITVTRTGAHDTVAHANYATSAGTATAGVDYTETSGTLDFAVGEVSKTFDVPILQDNSFAHDQTVNLTLSAVTGTGASLGTPNPALLTIHDTDDTAPVFSITQTVTHNEGNAGTTDFVFTVTKTGPTQLPATVDFATAAGLTNPGTGGVSCGAGVDYQSQNNTLTFQPSDTTKTITVKVCGDTTYEANEKFRVVLSNPTEATVSPTLGTGTGTINNDDAAPTLSINNVSKNEGNSGPTDFAFTVTKAGNATELPATVNFATVDGLHNSSNTGATGGVSCGAGIDYESQSGMLTFQPNETMMTIHVNVCGDPNYENAELFFVNLGGPTDASIIQNPGTGTIKNDDPIPTLSIDDVSQFEGDSGTTNFVFHITKTNATELPITVHAKTANHPTGQASAPSDFTAIADQTFTFPPSGTTDTQTITVLVNGDTMYEHDELFFVSLFNATNSSIIQFNGTGTIVNDDPAPTLSINNVTMAEGNAGTTNFTFTITKTGSTEVNATVQVDTANGTASAPSDYTAITNQLVTFLPADTTKQVTVTVNGDTNPEADETFFVNLSNPVDCAISQGQGTGTIQNDDPCPTVFTVNNNGDASDANPGDGLCATAGGQCTLRAAIEEANALTGCGPIDINFSIGSATITLTNGQLTVDHNVNINGPTASSIVIGGNNATRVFTVNSGKTVALSSLAISGGNGSGGDGGAIQNNGTLTLTSVTLSGNSSAHDGGAIRNDGTLTLINSTVSGNLATGDGGGILCGIAHTVNLANTTITANTASQNGGGVNTGGTVNARNTIIAGNNASSSGPDIKGSLTSQGNNLIGKSDGGSGFTNGANGDIVGTIASPVDPLLGALMNNGGPTFTHGLLYNSPAVDAGNDCVFTNTCSPSLGAPVTLDQRGLSRQANGDLVAGSHVDIGAYERQATESRPVAPGANVHMDLNDVRLAFPTVSGARPDDGAANTVQPNFVSRSVSITVIPVPGDAPPGSGPAFDVTPSTTFYTAPVDVCFYLPSVTPKATFDTLKVLHRESGLLVDHGSYVNFASKVVCTEVTSFSDFVITHGATPSVTNGTIDGTITDSSGAPLAGTTINLSGTQNRETITDAQGKYSFDGVGTNGFYTVTPTRANYTFNPANRSFSSLGAHTEASFTAAANGDHLNAIDTTEFFVRQQYLDFLGREPDPPGFNGWVNTLRNCAPGDTSCDRVHVSEAFFRSAEFQERGYFIYRFYSSAFGRKPDFAEFTPDLGRVSGFLNNDQLEAAKAKFVDDFMARPAFAAQYGSLSNSAYVDALINTAAVNLASRQALVDGLNAGTLTRAQVVRQIAESGEVYQKYYNQAFVVMEYFGYLRRDPDALYLNWIQVLDANPADSRHMVEGFVNSTEYRNRFVQ